MAVSRGMSTFAHNGIEYNVNDPCIADEFSTDVYYHAGSIAYYQGVAYRFSKDHLGAWIGSDANPVSIGQRLDGLISSEKWGVRDVLPLADTNVYPFTQNGVTVNRKSDGVYTFTGEVQSNAGNLGFWWTNVAWPEYLRPGHDYVMTISGASENCPIHFEVLRYIGDQVTPNYSGARHQNGVYKFSIPEDHTEGGCIFRIYWPKTYAGQTVNETIEFHLYLVPDASVLSNIGVMHFVDSNVSRWQSCDDVPAQTMAFVGSSGGVREIPDFPIDGPGTLVCFGYEQWRIQIAYSWMNASISKIRWLRGEWSGWVENGASGALKYVSSYSYTSCDDVDMNCFLFVGSSGGVLSIPDAPFIGYLQTFHDDSYIGCQIMYPWRSTDNIKYRSLNMDGWSEWRSIGEGGGTTTIVQEVSRDTYNNSYEITVEPEITTDTNGWLQAVDTNTQDETGKTDMTSAIMAMLNANGYCHLGPGIFYVSGNIDMPTDSILEGCGKKTIIRLLQTTTSGYILRMHTRSTVRNVCFSGGYSAGDISDGNIGGRQGIRYIGNRDGQDTGVTPRTTTCCMIEGCWFENLDSGFYGYNAGGGLQEGVICNSCYFTRCKAGINIDYWTEYCKFTNIITFQCYYACINNGGNNVFTACTFHGVIGFLIDNSSGAKANSAHGTVNGCTFNHIDNMNHPELLGCGYGIKVIDTVAGFIFSNCQLWYSKIYVENSLGVQFSDCEFGGGTPTLETNGNGTVFFHGCIFQNQPDKEAITSPVKFDNCYTYAGQLVTK